VGRDDASVRAVLRSVCLVTAVVALMIPAAVGAGASTPTTPSPGSAPLIDCSRANEHVTITVSSRLDPHCTYTGGFDITASGVILDCRNALLKRATGDVNAIAVYTDADSNLSNVTIRNCRIDGFSHGVDIARNGVNQLAAGHEYDHYLRNVTVEDTHISDTHAVGIYVHPYVTRTTLRRDVVTGAASTGVYLDEGSLRARIVDSVFGANGFVENGPGGTNTTFNGVGVRFWGPGREGIAVDGSSDNLIRGNQLLGNSAGGVFLYTNCGENVHTDPADWLDHRYGAEHNTIAGNTIVGAGTGVWIGSRMGENVYPMDCSDVPYVSGPLQAITLDRAAKNTVRGNTIVGADFGVRVEDDHAIVSGNTFSASNPADSAVVVGTPYRASALAEPVKDTEVARNVSTIVGNHSPYRWVDGVAALHDDHNVALGAASATCEAPDIPRGPFVMVYAIALQDPSQPPVPPPDYTVPSLGVLPACS
jgi:parallel beta-helix repeat protein